MSDPDRYFVRGFGDVDSGAGGIAWRLGEIEGGLILQAEEASVTGPDGVSDTPDSRWSFSAPVAAGALSGAAIFRHIAVESSGGVIVCTSSGPAGMTGHGEERTQAVHRFDDDEIHFEEALISTQYDGAGRPTRFGLELWPQEADQSNRAGATRVSGSLLGGSDAGSVWAGVFRCHADGAEGIGTYLLWRG